MSIWKKQENNKLMQEIKFQLAYYLNYNIKQIENILPKKCNYRNYWLQKREEKEIDYIVNRITKYINKNKG